MVNINNSLYTTLTVKEQLIRFKIQIVIVIVLNSAHQTHHYLDRVGSPLAYHCRDAPAKELALPVALLL